MSTGRPDNILDSIKQRGYYCRQDEEAGARAKEIIGLEEWDWTKSLSVLNSSIDDDTLAAIKALIGPFKLFSAIVLATPDRIICFMPKVKINVQGHDGILLLLLGPDSEVDLYPGSHLVEHRNDEPPHNNWGYQASKELLKSQDNMKMPEGGLYVSPHR
ncbi:MAG: hypothetical protein M1839_005362 [Geoglossum umbratile]|nr:MAG: hypothetical protein M1839_005362 [Geoglossum umbratile]